MKALGTAWKTNQQLIVQWPDKWRDAITEEKDRCKELLEQGAKQEAA
jgi:hypothetical protein